MRCDRLCRWGCVVLALAIMGCGVAPDEKTMAVPEENGAVFETVGSSLPIEPDDSAPPEWEPESVAADSPEALPERAAHPEPGGATLTRPVPIVAAPSLSTSMAFDTSASAPASTADDWPLSMHRATVAERSISRPVDDPPARASVNHVDEIVSNLDYGNVVYNAPTEMEFGETRVIEVLLSPSHTVEELTVAMRSPIDIQSASLQVGNRMEAKLSGSGFDIEPLSEPLQAVTSTRPTQWRFKVTPIEHGPQELHLRLLAHIDVDGSNAPLVVETKDALIEVNITLAQRVAGFASANWRWLWAAVFVPAIGFLWRRKTGHGRRSAPPKPHYRPSSRSRSQSAS